MKEEKETIEEIIGLLSEPISLYKKYKAEELRGEVDNSYIYDTAYEWLSNLRRGDVVRLLELLVNYETIKDEF